MIDVNKPEKLKEAINELIAYKNNATEIQRVTKETLGLSNVDNTHDADKPLSTPQKSYIDAENAKDVKLSSDTAQEINSDIVMASKKSISAKTENGTILNVVSITNENAVESIEVGSEEVPIKFNHSTKDMDGTIISKNPVIKIVDENGDVLNDNLALISDFNNAVKKDVLNLAEMPGGVVNYVEGQYFANTSVDSASLRVVVRSIKDGTLISNEVVPLKLASEVTRGLMSKEAYTTLNNLVTRVAAIEGKTSRYLYTDGKNPSASDIGAFVQSLGISQENYSGVAVVVASTYHVWHYYENDGWKDDGSDTVNQASNTSLGIVKGSTETGKVTIETDGTMSVVGWDSLSEKANSSISEERVQEMIDLSIKSAISSALGGSY